MKAWRFYGFNDMRLDEIPRPECRAGHVVAEVLCVQPSVTEALLALGIPTLSYEKIKLRLETEAPVQLFGHEFCVRIVVCCSSDLPKAITVQSDVIEWAVVRIEIGGPDVIVRGGIFRDFMPGDGK